MINRRKLLQGAVALAVAPKLSMPETVTVVHQVHDEISFATSAVANAPAEFNLETLREIARLLKEAKEMTGIPSYMLGERNIIRMDK